MTVSLEKVFFKYILMNKSYFQYVEPNYFKNPEINLVYNIVYKYMNDNLNTDVPKASQIYEMVALEDTDKRISKQVFKTMISTTLSEFDENAFLKPKIKAWILKERLKDTSDEVIEKVREMESKEMTLETIEEYAGKIRTYVTDRTVSNFDDDDDDLGSDFDDAESHIQDHGVTKVKTGWESLDGMLGGGFDISTLNILMGETNGGKSLWMQNIAANVANAGYNVTYFTLEMSEKKVLKRIGSMRLKIPINSYDIKSKDPDYIKSRIEELHKGSNNASDPGNLFNNKQGKINVKYFAAGQATIEHLENHLKKVELKRNFKPDLIIVDYITLMAPIKGLGIESNLYLKGKHLAEALRAMGSSRECAVITAMQIAKDAWNASDITLDKIPESKAIAETSDTFFAIIRTEEMKRNHKYVLKLLKQRDGDFSRSRTSFDLNVKYLTIENDHYINDFDAL